MPGDHPAGGRLSAALWDTAAGADALGVEEAEEADDDMDDEDAV